MDRMDGSSFARLNRVIMDLSKIPAPPGCPRLKWLLPGLRIVRRGKYVMVYAIDNKARMLRLLRIRDVTDGFDNFSTYCPQFASSLAMTTRRALDALRLTNVSTERADAATRRWDETRTQKLERCSISCWKAPGPARRLFAFTKANRDQIRL